MNMTHDDFISCKRVGESFIRQHQAMAEHIGHQIGHVLRQRIIAAAQEGEGARAFDEMNGRAWTCPESDVVREVLKAKTCRVSFIGPETAVTKTVPCQTTGLDWPWPGKFVCQAIFLLADHSSGRFSA